MFLLIYFIGYIITFFCFLYAGKEIEKELKTISVFEGALICSTAWPGIWFCILIEKVEKWIS